MFCSSECLQSALAAGLSQAIDRAVPLSDIHMPARAAAAGSPAAIRHGLDAARLADRLSETLPFPEVFGVQPVRRVRMENRWLLFDLSDEWYAAAADALIAAGYARPRNFESLPPAKHVFTHLIWHMQGWTAEIDTAPDGILIADAARLCALAFPSALRVYRKIAQSLDCDA